MKKIASILLIVLLFFNWYGYRLVISFMEDHADHQLESTIDNNDYDESRLVEIKVAMNMPYQERFTDFERHYGEIEINGQSYSYVKRKIAGDIVIFKCLPNTSKQKLNAIKNEWAKANSAADTDQQGKQQQESSLAKNFWSKYNRQDPFHPVSAFFAVNNKPRSGYSIFFPEVIPDNPFQPPKS